MTITEIGQRPRSDARPAVGSLMQPGIDLSAGYEEPGSEFNRLLL